MPLTRCKNILIVRTDRIGDVVLTTPMFKALRLRFPDARISVMVSPVAVDLVRGNPYIDEVLVDDRRGIYKGWLGLLRLARSIRQRSFDTAFIVHTKRRTNLVCFLAGVPCRIGYKNDKFGFMLTHPLLDERHQGRKHEVEYCLDLLKPVGVNEASADVFVSTNREAEVWAQQWLATNDIKPGDFIVIHPGASDPTRLWPVESYARLIDGLSGRYVYKIVLVGGKETMDVAAKIIQSLHTSSVVLNLTGQTSLAQTSSVLRRCRLLISSDSGPLHVAAGVGAYVLCLFLRNQPGINPTRWRPLGNRAFMLTNKAGEEIILDQKGSVVRGKPDSITVDEVLEAIERILTRDSQSLFYW